jgi:xanthine dehydrogenase YagR molybdenum-binding subunit
VTRPVPAALLAGQPVTRVDGRLKVTGKATYAADHAIPDHAYAALVCSTIARGTVERVD